MWWLTHICSHSAWKLRQETCLIKCSQAALYLEEHSPAENIIPGGKFKGFLCREFSAS